MKNFEFDPQEKILSLVVFPDRVDKTKGFLKLFRKTYGTRKPGFETVEITAKNITLGNHRAFYDLLVALNKFSAPEMQKTVAIMQEQYKVATKPQLWTFYQKQNLIKHHYELLKNLRPWIDLVNWYYTQRQEPGGNRWTTAPCFFSSYRPHLVFEVFKKKEIPGLKIFIELNKERFPLDLFDRQFFLLKSDRDCFMLYYTDYLTIERISSIDFNTYAGRFSDFYTEVIAPLEEKYTVNLGKLYKQEVVQVKPTARVLFSELNNAFLMLRPQWSYEGAVVEDPWEEFVQVKAKDRLLTIARNKEFEAPLKELLESLHPNFPKQRNGFYYLSFADAQQKQWFVKCWHRLVQSGADLLGLDMLTHFRYSTLAPVTHIQEHARDHHKVVLTLTVNFGKEAISLHQLQQVLTAGQRTLVLKDGSLGVLPDEWLNRHALWIKHGKVSGKELTLSTGLLLADEEDTILPAFKSLRLDLGAWKELWEKWQAGEELFAVPEGVQATLRPYQKKGYEWMRLLAQLRVGGCLADDMGLGKTLQAICFLAWSAKEHPTSRHLIICPASVIYNWQQELVKFMPTLSVRVYHGTNREDLLLGDAQVQVLITSYGTARRDRERIQEQVWHTLLIDESHTIKNPAALTTQAIQSFAASFCFVLSGTPVINSTFDLYSQLNRVVPGLLGNREFFKREYVEPIDYHHDEEKTKKLQAVTAPFILRRTKEQVAADLPDKTETVLWCEMSHSQREQYDSIKEQIRTNIFLDIQEQGLSKTKLAILAGLLKLRQICNSPLLLPKEEQISKASVKAEMLFEELELILSHHKVLVFSQFAGMLNILTETCKQKGISFFHFDGKTPAARRMEMVNAFQEEENKIRLFFISLKAGNTGINLTAADYVFLFDPWWNEAVQQQAIDRTHRIGQSKKVMAYKMICKDTIEEKILHLQQKKKKLSETLIRSDADFIRALNEEDLKWLFQ